jgi:spore maturation protein SpmB
MTLAGYKAIATELGKETLLTSWELIRILVPVAIITKILADLGLVTFLGNLLEPLMLLLGLPGALGLVWATAIFSSIYSAIAVFSVIAPGLELTGAQVTVLCAVMLLAHSLPIELSVSSRAGARLMPIAVVRLVGAIVYGYFLHRCCTFFHLWQDPSRVLFKATTNSGDYLSWAVDLLQNLCLIIMIILCILTLMRLFKVVGLLGLFERLLAPVLPHFGMGGQAAPITVVGMIMGIGYGGALIIRETATGKLAKDEIFHSMVLMGLCHGLIEDTLLMVAIGGKLGGVLWGRILFSLIVTYALVQLAVVLKKRRLETRENI